MRCRECNGKRWARWYDYSNSTLPVGVNYKGAGSTQRTGGTMKTMAQIIGVPDDPVVEEVRKLVYHGTAAIEQASNQRRAVGIIDLRRMEWDLATKIVETVRRLA